MFEVKSLCFLLCVCMCGVVFCQLVCQCCEEDSQDPSSVLEKLSSRVREGQLGQTTFLQLLGNIQQNVPMSFPPELCSLLEEVQKNRQELQEPQRPGAGEPPFMRASAK